MTEQLRLTHTDEEVAEYLRWILSGGRSLVNYTRPNDPNHTDQPEDWLNASLIFTQAISLLLEERTGIVVQLKGDSRNPVGKSDRVIVFRRDGQVVIDDCQQDLPEGALVGITDHGEPTQ